MLEKKPSWTQDKMNKTEVSPLNPQVYPFIIIISLVQKLIKRKDFLLTLSTHQAMSILVLK
jgi:hypothetical protein